MPFYADLHIHSKYARATSGDSDLEHLALWAAKKGVTVLGTGDFTHPAWLAEIKGKLVPAEPGLFRLKPELERWAADQFPAFAQQPSRFLLEVEISTIYKKGAKTRKVHHLHYVPDLATAERFIARLARIGNLNADGRPILGLDSRHLLEITLEAGEGAYLIPAHIWTPWFAALGSKSGFDTIEECYGDLTPHIFALETGLSSDPPMNWRLSQLDRFQLVSNSDAHSPPKIGREACVFDCALDYWAIRHALETGHGFGGTVEFFPEEGKYHLDGHRSCGVRFEPEETKRHGGVCPACGKELTVGVMHRIDELADRLEGVKPQKVTPFRSLVPLPEVLAEIHRVGAGSRKVEDSYEQLVRSLGSELFILEQAPFEELRKAGSTLLAEGIARMREGRVIREAGYDGEYGVIRVFTDDELTQGNSVSLLFALPEQEPNQGNAHAKPPSRQEKIGETVSAFAPLRLCESLSATNPVHGPGSRQNGLGGSQEPDPPGALPDVSATPFLPISCDPLAGLDPDQRAAVEITDGPLLIIAGPGTGKTRTLTHRIAHLVTSKNVAPEHILAVTFTNRAANEMRERLLKLLPAAAERVLVTTFHGLGWRILRENAHHLELAESLRIASETERRAMLVEKLKIPEGKAAHWLRRISQARSVAAEATRLKSNSEVGVRNAEFALVQSGWRCNASDSALQIPQSALDQSLLTSAATTGLDAELTEAIDIYRRALRERAWVDFDDLIGFSVELLQTHSDVLERYRRQYQHLSVDEFQDIDARQYRLVQLLIPSGGNLCVIGDPDQSIYSFRGANPQWFLRFAADYAGARTVHLHRNYRSGRAIVQGALQAIAPSTLREDRALEALSADSTKITIHESPTDKAEAELVVHTIEKLIGGSGFFSLDSGRVEGEEANRAFSFSDFAVLYRTDAQAEVLVEAFARSGIPFQRHSHVPLIEDPLVEGILEAARQMPLDWPVSDRITAALSDRALSGAAAERDLQAASSQAVPGASGSSHVLATPAPKKRERRAPAQNPSLFTALDSVALRCGRDFARFESELPLLSDADLWDPRADRVSLLTLHASKGLEFAAVFIVGCEDGILPLRWSSTDGDADVEEERRLFFVGMTRARDRLFLFHAKKRLWRGQLREQVVSPFVTVIEKDLLERSQSELKPREKPSSVQLDLFG